MQRAVGLGRVQARALAGDAVDGAAGGEFGEVFASEQVVRAKFVANAGVGDAFEDFDLGEIAGNGVHEVGQRLVTDVDEPKAPRRIGHSCDV